MVCMGGGGMGIYTPTINQYAVDKALILYEKYSVLKLCINRVKQDVNHELWLPNELWEVVSDSMKNEIENISIDGFSKVSLRDFVKYKDDYCVVSKF